MHIVPGTIVWLLNLKLISLHFFLDQRANHLSTQWGICRWIYSFHAIFFNHFIFHTYYSYLLISLKIMFLLRLLGHICFTWLRTYVMILCYWPIFWQNALYLYLGRLRMCLNTSGNHVSRSSVEAFKFVQENKLVVQIH